MTMKKSVLLFACTFTCFAFATLSEAEKKSRPLSVVENILVGGTAGAMEVTVGHPFLKLGNDLIRGMPLMSCVRNAVKDPKAVYTGYGVNVGSMIPITAVQTVVEGTLHGRCSDVNAATVAGAVSGLVSGPAELFMIQQQVAQQYAAQQNMVGKKGNSASFFNVAQSIVNKHGVAGLGRGFMPTATRDAIFTLGYCVMASRVAEYMGVDPQDKMKSAVLGGVPAGILTGVASHPFTVIRACMQADMDQKKYTTMADTIKTIWLEQGAKGFFTSLGLRTARVTLAIPLLSWAKNELTKKVHDVRD
jgi:hypothetical protein